MSKVVKVLEDLLESLRQNRQEITLSLDLVDEEIKKTEEALSLINPPLQLADHSQMNTTERVFDVINASPNGMTSMQVHEVLVNRGDKVTTYDTVRSTVSRLVRQKRLTPIFGTARYGVKDKENA